VTRQIEGVRDGRRDQRRVLPLVDDPVAEAEQFWREACEKNRIRRLTQDKPRPLFCMAGVISLAAVLGDSIPSSAHNNKKNRRRKRESALRQRYENVRSSARVDARMQTLS